MRETDLQTAVDEIVDSTIRRKGQFPFFLVVGSGISHPQIPLASGIEELCRKKLTERGRDLVSLTLDGKPALERYATLFETAYTQPEDRQEFLHDLIHRAPVSAANFRLAHLLGELQLTNLIFTPNFDEMLTRACRLLGYDVVVCDHPKTTRRIRLGADLPQIVHVHGTHWFYDCCNLKDEIEAQAQSDNLDGLSMGQLLDRVLADRSPIVVGYSGWEGDVIMAALKRRLRGSSLPRHLYWFCFKRTDADNLPSWLKDHASVRLVLPPLLPKVEERRKGAEAQFTGEFSSVSSKRLAGEESEKEPTLPARKVFEEFIRHLKLNAPRLTAEPLKFFAEHLQRNLVAEEEEEIQDFYFIRRALGRIREGARLEEESRQGVTRENIAEELLNRVSDAVQRSDYSGAIEVVNGTDFTALTPEQRARLEEALEKVYLGTSNPEEKVSACEIRVDLAEASRGEKSGNTSDWISRATKASQQLASAFIEKGVALGQAGRTDEEVAAYQEVERRFGDAPDTALREQVARALFNKGVALGQAGRADEAVAAYQEVGRRFGDAPDTALRELVSRALVNKGVALRQAGHTDEAVATYQEVERRFGDASEPALRELVSRAFVNKGVALRQAGRTDEAVAVYQEVEQRFGDAPDTALRELVSRALVNKGVALGQAGRADEAVTAYQEVEQRFGDAPDTAMREQVTTALFNKGVTLGQAGRTNEAVAAYQEVEQRFGAPPDTALRELVSKAKYNLACALARNGQPDNAFSKLQECLTKGEVSREYVLQDPDWEHLRDHPRFRELTKEPAR